MIPGETVLSGAAHPGTNLRVLASGGGYYIGYLTPTGEPYSRESNYFATFDEAQRALAEWHKGCFINQR